MPENLEKCIGKLATFQDAWLRELVYNHLYTFHKYKPALARFEQVRKTRKTITEEIKKTCPESIQKQVALIEDWTLTLP